MVEKTTTGNKYDTKTLFQGLMPIHWLWYSTGLQTALHDEEERRENDLRLFEKVVPNL